MTRCVLVSTYEMGRQPFGLASAAAWLRGAGLTVECLDVAKQRLGPDLFRDAGVVGVHLPMHTATRLAGPIITRVRRESPQARVCAFGLYAPLNAEWLGWLGVEGVFGGEFEEDLTTWATGARLKPRVPPSGPVLAGQMEREASAERLPRIHFLVPDRAGLPPLSRYASLQLPDG